MNFSYSLSFIHYNSPGKMCKNKNPFLRRHPVTFIVAFVHELTIHRTKHST